MQYLASVITFLSAIIAIKGNTWSDSEDNILKKITVTGYVAILIASASLLITIVIIYKSTLENNNLKDQLKSIHENTKNTEQKLSLLLKGLNITEKSIERIDLFYPRAQAQILAVTRAIRNITTNMVGEFIEQESVIKDSVFERDHMVTKISYIFKDRIGILSLSSVNNGVMEKDIIDLNFLYSSKNVEGLDHIRIQNGRLKTDLNQYPSEQLISFLNHEIAEAGFKYKSIAVVGNQLKVIILHEKTKIEAIATVGLVTQ